MSPELRRKKRPIIVIPKEEPYYTKMFDETTLLCEECGYAIPFDKNSVEAECLVCGARVVLLG